ncbi:MAG: DUF1343 domain-containing protein [Bacteroidia bacterium]|nr:DUF1343 domain-containing protein [Bacteroidia bacterium]MCZ2249060.1 DUF1343 domain-containing protein [Bacteroidia bacterium]
MMNTLLRTFLILSITVFCTFSCIAQGNIQCGAERMEKYLPLIQSKNVSIVGNQTSVVGKKSLLDTLLSLQIKVINVFSPEHGFRGTASAGERVANDIDSLTGIQVKSLYGSNKKPDKNDLKDIDVMLFDLQDVGVRFYTYISTLHYVMQACAEQNVELIVLDRPNPNGFYIDGPVLNDSFASFVGMHKVPVVYGMTIGEYAQMINGENWIKTANPCKLQVITCKDYTHQSRYFLPIKPSPNLPNHKSILLYPTLCFFEGTVISVGRGTDKPFQQYGHPEMQHGEISFTPQSLSGASNPLYANKKCYGFDLSNNDNLLNTIDSGKGLQLEILFNAYSNFPNKEQFFNSFFNKLAGNSTLQKQIKQGLSTAQIKSSWQTDIDKFKTVRAKYLLYPDFE